MTHETERQRDSGERHWLTGKPPFVAEAMDGPDRDGTQHDGTQHNGVQHDGVALAGLRPVDISTDGSSPDGTAVDDTGVDGAAVDGTPPSGNRPDGAETPALLGPLSQQLAQLAQTLLEANTVGEVLARVVAAARAVLTDADLVSITMRGPDGDYTTPVRTDELADRLDELQYEHGEGPCVQATRTPGPGGSPNGNNLTGSPWPAWGPAAAALGVRSVLAVGLFPFGDPPRLGALNLYSTRRGGLDAVDRDLAVLLASHAAVAMAATQAVTAADLRAAQLGQALATRDVIGQAKGILMQRRGVSADEAFGILRRASQDLNIKLALVAERFVAHRDRL
jgi:hypothetical protein